MYKFLLLLLFISAFATAMAQKPDTVLKKSRNDSLTLKHDSAVSKPFKPKITKEKTYHPDSLHSPHKAVIRSLILPGWGQLYNHRWWKLPFIYAGIGLLGDAIVFNQHYYSIFLKEAELREKGAPLSQRNPQLTGISDDNIVSYSDSYRRNRDLSILGTLGAWGIQMIDAYVDAKFIKSYTMDNNLSFKLTPGVLSQPAYALNNGSTTFIPSLTVTFTLR